MRFFFLLGMGESSPAAQQNTLLSFVKNCTKLVFFSTDVVEDTLDLASHTSFILKFLSLPRWKLK